MSIRIGIASGLGGAPAPQEVWRWIDYCEESGIDSIWPSDQLLGATMEPMAMLAAIAARTRRLRFGTNALVLPFRDPLVVAKQLATISHLGEGRLFPVLGVGADTDPYWAATGASPKGRGSRANEAIRLIRLLLDQEHVDFAGEHYRYQGPGVQPKPRTPIPLWIGGNSKAAIARTAELGDGWLGSLAGPDVAGAARRGIEAELARNGRAIEPDHYGMSLLMRIGSPDDPQVVATKQAFEARVPPAARASLDESFVVGPPDDVAAIFGRYVAQGMSKFVAVPMAADADDLMRQTRMLVDKVLPQVED